MGHDFQWDVSSDRHAQALNDYRESFEGLYEISDVELGPRGIFFNRTKMSLFGSGVIGRGRSNSQTLSRSAPEARRASLDSIGIVLAESTVCGEAGDRSYRGGPGSIIFVDHSRPSAARWQDLALTTLIVPRGTASAWLANADLHGLVLRPEQGAALLLASHLRTLTDVAPGLDQAEGQAAIGAALAIAETALGGSPNTTADQAAAVYRTVRDRASRYLELRLLDPALTPDHVARACAVSRATLYRAFGGQGGLMRQIQNRRLERAREALAGRTGRTPSVADIAHAHGFASATHFSRVYRERFGISPSDQSPLPRRVRRVRRDGIIRHDAAVDWLNGNGFDPQI